MGRPKCVIVFRTLFAAALCSLAATIAWAQADRSSGLLNRPPVAAPTTQIQVAPIQVVRSAAELFTDFGGGLLQGLLTSHGLKSAASIAAQDNRIIATRALGCCVESLPALGDQGASDLLAAIAVMQLVERQGVNLDTAVPGGDHVTVEQ